MDLRRYHQFNVISTETVKCGTRERGSSSTLTTTSTTTTTTSVPKISVQKCKTNSSTLELLQTRVKILASQILENLNPAVIKIKVRTQNAIQRKIFMIFWSSSLYCFDLRWWLWIAVSTQWLDPTIHHHLSLIHMKSEPIFPQFIEGSCEGSEPIILVLFKVMWLKCISTPTMLKATTRAPALSQSTQVSLKLQPEVDPYQPEIEPIMLTPSVLRM